MTGGNGDPGGGTSKKKNNKCPECKNVIKAKALQCDICDLCGTI